jgi:Bifunctional DNA primase/polymerase, N-terminal/Primase C terminal 1 (PriCT-1)
MTYSPRYEHTSNSGSPTTLYPRLTPSTSKHLQNPKKNSRERPEKSIAKVAYEERDANEQSALLAAALWYAERGLPVFPLHWVDDQGKCSCSGKPGCKPGKHPLIPGGHLGATTAPGQIRQWWSRWPDANIGIPAGERSRLLILDVDDHGFTSLAALEEEHSQLPETLTVRTGGGGRHKYLIYPAGCEIRNSVGRLGLGLDVRGEGGYTVAPPSRTDKGSYEVLNGLPPAEPPEWLLEALRGHHNGASPRSHGVTDRGRAENLRGSPGPIHATGGEPIPEGTRDNTLFKIGCRLRAQGHSEGAILDALRDINRSRCTPSLPDAQVRQKARQAARYVPGDTAPEETPRVQATIDYLACVQRPVKGMGGATGWSIYRAGLELLRRYGREHPEGVELSVDVRTWAQMAGTTHTSVGRFIKRSPLVCKLRHGSGRRSGSVLFVVPTSRAGKGHQAFHSTTREGAKENLSPRSGTPSALLRTLERLRWGPGRIGKSRAAILHAMVECGGHLSRAEIAARLGKEKAESLRAPLRWLVDQGLLERPSHGVYTAPADLARRVENARELGREPEADRLQMQRHDRERDAYRRKIKPDRSPTMREMDERRWSRLKTSGRISELEVESKHFPDVFVGQGDPQVPLGEP